MTELLMGVNPVAVASASLVMMAVGIVWYSPFLAGGFWVREIGLSGAPAPTMRQYLVRFAAHVLSQLMALFAISIVLAKAAHVLAFAALLALAFALLQAGAVVWERRTLWYLAIDGIYMAVVIIGGGAIIYYWPW